MSGIVGMLRPDGGQVDVGLVRALTRFLAFRGPDEREVWNRGSVALGHAMLRTTEESALERQPAEFESRLWITADARLDARGELIETLTKTGRNPGRNAPDSELILHAYAAWGEECLQRLRGDFAFGIWDARRRSLFCARDHFGIKPFYFTEQKDFFLFSNTLDCVRMHPEVSDELNEMAIADFLLFGLNCDQATTTFRAIRRLPPAHFLRVSADGLRMGRYWSVPIDGHIRYKHSDQYVEHFQMLLRQAVSDRLNGGRVGIFLSGGLDSSSVAATARELAPVRGESGKLRAYTVTCGSLVPDRDPPYAQEVADFLGIPIRYISIDGLEPFDRWDELRLPEPVNDALAARVFDQFRAIGEECRIALDSEGPDNLMHFQMWPYVRYLLRRGDWRQLCHDVPRYLRRRPSIWRGAMRRVGGFFSAPEERPKFPDWLDPDFARRVDAKRRWREGFADTAAPVHPVVPAAHGSLSLPQWQQVFEGQDAGSTRCTVEARYPYLDLRIVNYVLGLPPFPWSFQKTLSREAMFARIPERVRRRPKTPLDSDPVIASLRQRGPHGVFQSKWNEEIDRFVNRSVLLPPRSKDMVAAVYAVIKPLCLNFWLQHSWPFLYKGRWAAEARNG